MVEVRGNSCSDRQLKARELLAVLESSLETADELGLQMVAIHISHAIDLLKAQSRFR